MKEYKYLEQYPAGYLARYPKILEQYLKTTAHERERGSEIPGMVDNKLDMYDNNIDGVLDKVKLGMYLVSLDKDPYELHLDVSINELLKLVCLKRSTRHPACKFKTGCKIKMLTVQKVHNEGT